MSVDIQDTHFVTQLLAWFSENKRVLPWRQNKDPYRIWVSEVMLQQTRVDTVIPFYERFMKRFPTVQALAESPEEEVLKHWEGLGYYSRARNLQTAVREVHTSYGGKVPEDPEKFGALKGVGPYTRGAVLSIAYNMPEPAVDGNVMRVLSRYYLIEDDIAKAKTRVSMEHKIRSIIPKDNAGDFNQAIMELGALVCTPRQPQCNDCPIQEHCMARKHDMQLELPVKKKAKPPRPEQRVVAIIEGSGKLEGKLLFRQRPSSGLLAGLWELPHELIEQLPEEFGAAMPVELAAAETVGESVYDAAGDSKDLAEAAGKTRKVNVAGKAETYQQATAQLEMLVSEENEVIGTDKAQTGDHTVTGESNEQQRLGKWLEEHLNIKLQAVPGLFMETEHIFSHIRWNMRVYRYKLDMASDELEQGHSLPSSYAWLTEQELDELTLPNVFIRIINHYKLERL